MPVCETFVRCTGENNAFALSNVRCVGWLHFWSEATLERCDVQN